MFHLVKIDNLGFCESKASNKDKDFETRGKTHENSCYADCVNADLVYAADELQLTLPETYS